MRADALVDFGSVSLYPAKDSRGVYVEPPLTHHLFNIAIRKLIPTVPPDAQKNNGGLVVTPLERGLNLFQEYDSLKSMAELEGGL